MNIQFECCVNLWNMRRKKCLEPFCSILQMSFLSLLFHVLDQISLFLLQLEIIICEK